MAHLVPFPEKFHLVREFMDKHYPIETCSGLNSSIRLALYSLQQQATIGVCNTKSPSSWNVREKLKWDAWKELGGMSQLEAMVFYVQLVEREVDRQWFEKLRSPEQATLPGQSVTSESLEQNGSSQAPLPDEEKPRDYESALLALNRLSLQLQSTAAKLSEALQSNERLRHELDAKTRECCLLRQQIGGNGAGSGVATDALRPSSSSSLDLQTPPASSGSGQHPQCPRAFREAAGPPSVAPPENSNKIVHYYYSSSDSQGTWWSWLWPWRSGTDPGLI
eukprot:RCo029082